MTKKKVLIIGGGHEYAIMYLAHGWEIATDKEDADLFQFTGGSDVTPSLYGELPHVSTQNDVNRDKRETEYYNYAQATGIPCVGICRGGQFLNVMNGGKMFQDVDNHCRTHPANVLGHVGQVMVSSTHHQMMRPNRAVEHIVLVTANEATYKENMSGKNLNRLRVGPYSPSNDKEDIESVYYPDTLCLCYQPHPEFTNAPKACTDVFFFLLNNYLMAELDIADAYSLSHNKVEKF